MKNFFVAALLAASPVVVRAADPSPVGKPADMEKGQTVRYFVWVDDGGWHVRATTGKRPHHFTGMVRVKGGTVGSVAAVDAGPQGRRADFWEVKDSGREIAFDLTTRGELDGFDFALGKMAEAVEFDLLVDGEKMPNRVFVGKDATPIKAAAFAFRLSDLAAPATSGIAGKWTGSFVNSVGEKGESSLDLEDVGGGKFAGKWDDGLPIKDGTRAGDIVAWTSVSGMKTYAAEGTVGGGGKTMTVKYKVSRPGKGVVYTGEAIYTRQ